VNYIKLSRNYVTVPSTNGLTFKLLKFIHHVNAKSNGLWNTMPFAYKALQAEDKIGTMLPCNVIVQEKVAGQVEVSAVDPSASMLSIENKDLQAIATEIRSKLKKVIDHL